MLEKNNHVDLDTMVEPTAYDDKIMVEGLYTNVFFGKLDQSVLFV